MNNKKESIDYNLIAHRLYTARTDKKITLEEAGKVIGVNKSTIQRWENGNVEKFRIHMLEALSNFYGVSSEWIMGKGDAVENSNLNNSIPIFDNIQNINNNIVGNKKIGTVYIPNVLARSGEFLAIKMNENSMSPVILENDIIVIKKQDNFKNNDIIVFMTNDNNIMIRKVKEIPSGILLQCFNTDYDPFLITYNELSNYVIKIVGVVKRLERDFI